MITENLSTLRIHKLTQKQFDRESAAENLEKTALYLTPDTSITPWQSDTEYKVGDVVYATSIGYLGATMDVIAECTQAHNSGDIGIYVNGDKWLTRNIYAYSSIHDGNGNVIDKTYTTKDELTKAIGEALEGDY